MCQSGVTEARLGINSPDPLATEAFSVAHDSVDHVNSGGIDRTMGSATCTAANCWQQTPYSLPHLL